MTKSVRSSFLESKLIGTLLCCLVTRDGVSFITAFDNKALTIYQGITKQVLKTWTETFELSLVFKY